MRTIPARDIKRRGIRVVDEALKDGPVHIIRNDRPKYVILAEEQYQTLVSMQEEAYLTRIKAALKDVKSGRVRRVTARQLIHEFGLDD